MASTKKNHYWFKSRYWVASAIILLGILITILELTNVTHFFHNKKYVPASKPSTSTTTKTPTSTTPDTTKNNPKTTGSNPTSSNTQSASGTVTISRVSQPAGSTTVSLRTVINGISSGTCVVVFSKNGQPDVQQTAAVITNANYYSCAGVDIPVSQFSVSGLWNVSVYVINAQSVTISNIATSNDIQVTK